MHVNTFANVSIYSSANVIENVIFQNRLPKVLGVALKCKCSSYAFVNAFEFILNVCYSRNKMYRNTLLINYTKSTHVVVDKSKTIVMMYVSVCHYIAVSGI